MDQTEMIEVVETVDNVDFTKKELLKKLIIFLFTAALLTASVVLLITLIFTAPNYYWVGMLAILITFMVCVFRFRVWRAYRSEHAQELGLYEASDEVRAAAWEKWEKRKKEQEAKAEIRRGKDHVSKRHPNRIKESTLDIFLSILNLTLLLALVLIIVFPLLNYFSLAFNDGTDFSITFYPKSWTTSAFAYVLAGEGAAEFWRAFLNSIIITVVVTIGSNLVEAMAAYPLSKRDCPFRGGILMYFIITMLFSAGIAPIYILMHTFGLIDSIWSLILISISNVTHLLYFKTFFEGVPVDIEEAARLDGASELQLFFRIIVPMSLPIIGSCCFFTIVGTWNGYGTALLFIHQSAAGKQAQPLAYYIYLMLQSSTIEKNNPWMMEHYKNVEAAAMLASIIPIICIYPYVIKYIKSGLSIGSVKG